MTMRVFDPSPRYKSYLLRCWQERSRSQNEQSKLWRFSLEDTRSGQQRGFANLEALTAYLQAALAAEEEEDPKGF